MTEFGFYHLTVSTLEKALPRLLERVLEAQLRAVVVTDSVERAQTLDRVLWTYTPLSFLPHGCSTEAGINGFSASLPASKQPVWITTTAERPNGAQVLVLTDGATCATSGQDAEAYTRCAYMFDGNDAEGLARARQLWKSYQQAGHVLAYWQQTITGAWEKGSSCST